jgi:hypothetical protein
MKQRFSLPVKKNRHISVFSVTKPKNFIVFAFTYVSESSALFLDDFCITSHNVDSDEAMKLGNEALNASSLQFLRSVYRFIATFFTER